MPAFNGQNLQERQSAAAEARKAQVAKFLSRPAPDDPSVLEREAKRRAINEARNIRTAERNAQRAAAEAAEAARKVAEEIARQEQLKAAAEAAELAVSKRPPASWKPKPKPRQSATLAMPRERLAKTSGS